MIVLQVSGSFRILWHSSCTIPMRLMLSCGMTKLMDSEGDSATALIKQVPVKLIEYSLGHIIVMGSPYTRCCIALGGCSQILGLGDGAS